MKVRLYFCFYALLMVLCLFSGCSADDSTPSEAAGEIRVITDVWKMMEGTRATTFDNATDLQTESYFTCIVFNKNTTTEYIEATQIDWIGTSWVFSDGPHNWPSGALDFFAYMPAEGSLPSYITSGPIYTADHHVTFTCEDLPMTHATQGNSLKEFIFAMALDQDKYGTNTTTQPSPGEVALTFKHPFARIKIQLSSTQENIHINSITFKSIKNNGSCSFDGSTSSWTPSGDATNFVATLNADYVANDEIGTYIMIPQEWAGEIEVSADWSVWGVLGTHTVTTTVPTSWQAGYNYTYTFTITETDLKVDTSKFTEQW